MNGRHLTATLTVKAPGKGKYHDYRQLSVRPSSDGKTAQTSVKTLDGLSFDVWYGGRAIAVQPNMKRAVVGVKRAVDLMADVWEGAFAIGNVPFVVTVKAQHVSYEVKRSNGKDTFALVESHDKANPAQTPVDASTPNETRQEAHVEEEANIAA